MKNFSFLWISFFIILLSAFALEAQKEVLFSVEDLKVTSDEFQYVFEKNNNAATNEADIKEYLDLYKKFKLKVKAAYDKKMDTLPHLNDELNVYRRQLSKNYLLDKQLQEKVAREIYERKQVEIKIAHVVLATSTPEEVEPAREKLTALKPQAEEGFGAIAKQYSDDPGTSDKGGVIGYLSSPFAKGFEEVEDLAYELNIGEIGGPVESEMGVHLIKVIERRPAQGEMELSHIFVRKPKPKSMNIEKETERKREKIEEAYRALADGTSFKHATLKFSEDDKTKYNDGYLGYIEPNTYEEDIEEAVFALEASGEYTRPLESSLGWHIFMRGNQRKPQNKSYEESRAEILSELKYTNRLDRAQSALIAQIKQDAPFRETSKWPYSFRENLPQNFARYDWELPEFDEKIDTLFQFGSSLYKTQNDFIKYLKRNTRQRLRLDRKMTAKKAFDKIYQDFITEAAIEYEESQLEMKYPEFRHLMREYQEGILLFEITKERVWDKAPRDSAGLKQFYSRHKEDYMWNDRAKLLEFKLKSSDPKLCDKTTNMLIRRGVDQTIDKMNKDSIILTYTSTTLEKGKTDQSISWQEKVLFDVQKNPNYCSFKWIDRIIPSQTKTLEEAKGYVISDYQNELEKEWVESLQKKYDIDTNKKVLKSLIKSYKN